jgi:hypothetical protein
MEIKQLLTVLPILPASISVLLRGPHGIGKSALPRHVGKVLGLPVVDRRLSQMSEGDLVGLPELVNGVTRFAPPDWYKKACLEPTIVFLDELNRATPEVMQAAFQIVLDRELNGHRLHSESRVYSAINSSAEYQVNDMDPALLDRFWVADVDATVQDWLAWAKSDGGIGSDIVDFVMAHEQHLRHSGQMEPGKVYPSQRSWERLDIALKHAGLAADPANPLFLHVAQGLLGIETSLAFQDFVKNVQLRTRAEDVMIGWKKNEEKIKGLGLDRKNDLIEKVFDHCKANDWTDVQVDNFKEFFLVLPEELRLSMWTKICSLGRTRMDNVKKVHIRCGKFVVGAVDNGNRVK